MPLLGRKIDDAVFLSRRCADKGPTQRSDQQDQGDNVGNKPRNQQ